MRVIDIIIITVWVATALIDASPVLLLLFGEFESRYLNSGPYSLKSLPNVRQTLPTWPNLEKLVFVVQNQKQLQPKLISDIRTVSKWCNIGSSSFVCHESKKYTGLEQRP